MNFQQLISILWARKKIALLTLLVTVVTTMLVSLSLPKQYDASVSLIVDQHAIDPVTGQTVPVQLMANYMATQVDIITSRNVALKVVKKLKLTEDKVWQEDFAKTKYESNFDDWIANIILEDIDIQPSHESSLLKINFSSDNPQFSVNVANAFAEAYILTTVELQANPAKQRANWFNSQIVNSRKRLENARNVLSEYQQKYDIVVEGDGRLNMENQQLVDLSNKIMENQVKTSELQSRKKQLDLLVKKGGLTQSVEEVISHSFIQSLKSDLALAESNFAELTKRVDKNHPLYKRALAEVSALRKKIKSEIKIVLNSISSSANVSQQRDEDLEAVFIEQKKKVLQLKKQRDQLAVFIREVENAQQTYDKAMQRYTQTRMESEISQANAVILNPAVPPQKHSSPKLFLNLVLAIFLGSVLGIGASLMIELADRRVRSPTDIYDTLNIPVLGVVSEHSNRSNGTLLSHTHQKKYKSIEQSNYT